MATPGRCVRHGVCASTGLSEEVAVVVNGLLRGGQQLEVEGVKVVRVGRSKPVWK